MQAHTTTPANASSTNFPVSSVETPLTSLAPNFTVQSNQLAHARSASNNVIVH